MPEWHIVHTLIPRTLCVFLSPHWLFWSGTEVPVRKFKAAEYTLWPGFKTEGKAGW